MNEQATTPLLDLAQKTPRVYPQGDHLKTGLGCGTGPAPNGASLDISKFGTDLARALALLQVTPQHMSATSDVGLELTPTTVLPVSGPLQACDFKLSLDKSEITVSASKYTIKSVTKPLQQIKKSSTLDRTGQNSSEVGDADEPIPPTPVPSHMATTKFKIRDTIASRTDATQQQQSPATFQIEHHRFHADGTCNPYGEGYPTAPLDSRYPSLLPQQASPLTLPVVSDGSFVPQHTADELINPDPAFATIATAKESTAPEGANSWMPTTRNLSPDDQVKPAVVRMIQRDTSHSINLQLTPKALGNVEIQIDLKNFGPLQIKLTVEHPNTLALLQRDHEKLSFILLHAGVANEGHSVSFQLATSQHQQEFTQPPGVQHIDLARFLREGADALSGDASLTTGYSPSGDTPQDQRGRRNHEAPASIHPSNKVDQMTAEYFSDISPPVGKNVFIQSYKIKLNITA